MKLILVAALALALIAPARADEAPKAPAKTGWSDFIKNFKNALAQSAVGGERKKIRGGVQGVSAVRGKRQKNIADPNEPGLKGDASSVKERKARLLDDELAPSVELLSEGKYEAALKGLEKFKAEHPLHMTADVDKAIEGAKAAIAEKGAAPQPEAATAQ